MQWIGRRYDTGEWVQLTAADGVIQAISPVLPDDEAKASETWISPGWIDLQVNGFAGFDLNGDVTTEQDVAEVTNALFRHGVTTYCPTVITGSFARMNQAFRAIHSACETNKLLSSVIGGIHVEGPYLSAEDGPRGAHDKAHIRDPDMAEFDAWQHSAGGRIVLCTIAPEREGAVEFIKHVIANGGVKVSIGHTMADAEQLKSAVEAGAALSTHLGNGAHPVMARHPNYIWDQLAEDGLHAMFIGDGHHLTASVLKSMIRVKRDRFILVSDSVMFGGMPPGRYPSMIGQEVELLSNGRLQTAADPRILAGSAQALDRGVENAMRLAGVSLREAIDAVTKRPAEAMGWPMVGKLEVGARANLTLFKIDSSGSVNVQQTVVNGETVWNNKQQSLQEENGRLT
ncbi:N-acetylglucosamine-6-phosphate deacetylase [Paenibacillus sp. CF384]|uniref:N-acetylglucosamine-6-phosphate deacetylase n=1 Tax=Paenibacillus sp. CF384 TaxID=1884382 RepID=UPI000899365A|nr:amidohydrolase family protein [Paenibacillus sp. CF384]SDW16562.1 N-acetylglucosamine-6-phosphate deacetylase [Paenibacillus sp. CF384]